MEVFRTLRASVRSPILVPIRTKWHSKHPKPAKLERRIFQQITQPIYARQFDDSTSKCSVEKYRKYESMKTAGQPFVVKENLYESFLIREAKKIFENNEMIIALQEGCMDMRRRTRIQNQLLSAGLKPVHFPFEVVRKTIDGTVWTNMQPLICDHTILVVSPKPLVKELLKCVKKIPEVIVLGGFVGSHLLTKQGLVNYSTMPAIDGVLGQLVSLLNAAPSRTRSLLQSHQQNLSQNLDQYVKQGSSEVAAEISKSAAESV